MSTEENEIILDLEELKKEGADLNENLLRVYGTQLELILRQMFDMPIFGSGARIKGKKKDLRALAAALGNEKKYIETARKMGMNSPAAKKSMGSLKKAIGGVEKLTGLKRPFK